MSEKVFFVSQTGTVVVECPQCRNSKLIPVATFKGKKFTVNVKCPCGHIFALNLDFRKHHRKSALLEGNFQKTNLEIESFYAKLPVSDGVDFQHTAGGGATNCTVTDISIGGIGLDVWGPHTIEAGDRLLVEFLLDNKKNSLIRCAVIVKTVQKSYVGAEFEDESDYNSDLRFYLLP